jgi:hypothetical protein
MVNLRSRLISNNLQDYEATGTEAGPIQNSTVDRMRNRTPTRVRHGAEGFMGDGASVEQRRMDDATIKSNKLRGN